MDDGLVVPGVRHYSTDMREVMRRIYGESGYWKHETQQGFIDSGGNFLTRKEAYKRADELGQVNLFDPAGSGHLIPQKPNKGDDMELFSENLY